MAAVISGDLIDVVFLLRHLELFAGLNHRVLYEQQMIAYTESHFYLKLLQLHLYEML